MFVVKIEGDDEFEGEVRGECQYQEALERIVGGRSDASVEVQRMARLVPEPDNPHDPNAVRVEIEGALVGYISRDEARAVGAFLRAQGGPWAAGECRAMIVGGWVRRGDVAKFGVRLDMVWPLQVEQPPVYAYHVSGIQPAQPNPNQARWSQFRALWLLVVVAAAGLGAAAMLLPLSE